MCDYNCCCDPDCSDAQKSRFSEVGCADQGSTPKKTQLCYDSVDLYKINPRLPLGGEPTVEASVGGALCVEKYNGATELEYFKDTAVQTADIFTVTAGKKDYNYGDKSEPSVRFVPCVLNQSPSLPALPSENILTFPSFTYRPPTTPTCPNRQLWMSTSTKETALQHSVVQAVQPCTR